MVDIVRPLQCSMSLLPRVHIFIPDSTAAVSPAPQKAHVAAVSSLFVWGAGEGGTQVSTPVSRQQRTLYMHVHHLMERMWQAKPILWGNVGENEQLGASSVG